MTFRTSRRIRVLTLVGVLGGVLAVPGIARADLKVFLDGNDTSGVLDIRSITQTHDGSSVVHRLRTFSRFGSRSLRGGDAVIFGFDTDGRLGSGLERQVVVSWVRGKLRARAFNKKGKFLGSVPVSRPSSTSVRVEIPLPLLATTGTYRWIGATVNGPAFDVAPNKNAVTHDLTGPKIQLLWFPDPSTEGVPGIQALTPDFDVQFSISDDASGIAHWELQRREYTGIDWSVIASGSRGGLKDVKVDGEEGKTYVFFVTAWDKAGNQSTGPVRTVSVPLDDSNPALATAFQGPWATVTGCSGFLNGFHENRNAVNPGDPPGSFDYTFTGEYFAWLAGDECVSNPGLVTVNVDGTLHAVDSADVVGVAQIVFETFLSFGPHHVVISGDGEDIPIDGIVTR